MRKRIKRNVLLSLPIKKELDNHQEIIEKHEKEEEVTKRN